MVPEEIFAHAAAEHVFYWSVDRDSSRHALTLRGGVGVHGAPDTPPAGIEEFSTHLRYFTARPAKALSHIREASRTERVAHLDLYSLFYSGHPGSLHRLRRTSLHLANAATA
jgi:hypothetical protein